MKKAQDHEGSLTEFLAGYRYQPMLTQRLDGIGVLPFDQETINEIVLWKVNRYAPLSADILAALNSVQSIEANKHRDANDVLVKLLAQPGVDLPMASTLLRFRAPHAFQIVDRHAYRAVYGEDYPLYASSGTQAKAKLYFEYLDCLQKISGDRQVSFEILDRVLYVFDKQLNGKL